MAEAPIVRVELFEDRASVVRRVEVPAGRHTVTLDRLTPLVREQGLAFESEDGVLVDQTEITRTLVEEGQSTAQTAELHEKLEAAQSEREKAEATIAACEDRIRRALASREAAQAWTPRVLSADIELDAWLDSLRTLEAELEDARNTLADARAALRGARWAEERWTARLEAAWTSPTHQVATLVLTVVAESEGSLLVRYTIPCALWRPAHRATLEDDTVHWETGAMVWNATGEDWEDVELICSTARPGDHADPPHLEDDTLYARRREKQVVVEARDETVARAREGEAQAVDEVLGVDDGGEPRTFTARHPATIPSDGAPVRIPLETWTSETEVEWRAHPELSGLVVLRTRQTNTSARPLLAGPVALFRDSGAVGRTRIDLVPSGEPFPLCWGSHDGLRVTRRTDRRTERSRLTGYQSLRFSTEIRVVHLGDQAIDLRVLERIPVSELDEVEVTSPSTEPRCDDGPDQDGFLGWSLSLEPGDEQTLRLTWSVEAPRHVKLPF